MGVWYEIQAEPSFFQSIKSCLSSSYKHHEGHIEVNSQGFDSAGSPVSTKFTLRIVDPENPAHMRSNFVLGVDPPFDVIDTDYQSFSCTHSCISIGGIKTEFVFIYSRNRTLNEDKIKHCHSIFESYGINVSTLVNTPQEDCHDHSDL
nr:crustacyanin-A2 subunit-like [Cherax quadricarinatus]